MPKSIRIQKTDFSLPVIQLVDYDISKISDELKQFMPISDKEFLSIPCVLSVEGEELEPTFFAQLLESLRQFGFLPVGIKTDNTSFIEQAKYAGLAVFNQKMNQLDLFDIALQNRKNQELEALQEAPETPKFLTHHRTICSGEQVYAEDCDLIVLGDVEQGAEVIADGNIYIGGSLLGKAYAGNSGLMNIDEISVRAYSFEPELVSIAGFYQLQEDIPQKYIGLSVKVSFEDQKLQYALE
ncbi:septum site-determining protein MinC [Thiomicrorhabdus lithotrophica]|uniref:Probable septum site-determining protein MinC n=1 Tax=Thiomicrorhabdus lithotrophica TaxID=2949997 RepID=A0ABY8CDX3_9GAMM|nr:septum site-determining protein MinC [Thiomicrorhabdus lithotrophica]WEJ63687.1 septum site-determining protein MinC [Thiomicrorhabdus lithotrophica]